MCFFLFVHFRYKQDFFRAFYTFRYQIIFDPITKSQRPLTKPEKSFKLTLHSYLGSIETDQSSALDKARGLVNPISGSKTNLSIPPSYDFFRFISSPKMNNKQKVILQQHVKSAAAALRSKKRPKSSVS